MIYKGRFTIIRSATRKEEKDGQKHDSEQKWRQRRITEDFRKNTQNMMMFLVFLMIGFASLGLCAGSVHAGHDTGSYLR